MGPSAAVDHAGRTLEPLLPKGSKPGRPPKWSKPQLIDEIRWRVRVGASWRDVPAGYGPWQSVYGLFRRWQRDGTWMEVRRYPASAPGSSALRTRPRPVATGTSLLNSWLMGQNFRQSAGGIRADHAAQL